MSECVGRVRVRVRVESLSGGVGGFISGKWGLERKWGVVH